MPVTSITYQWKYNKNYISPHLQTGRKIYGELNTIDLEKELREEIDHSSKVNRIVSMINDPQCKDMTITTIITGVTLDQPRLKIYTKTRRSYYWGGLTIHEEDTK